MATSVNGREENEEDYVKGCRAANMWDRQAERSNNAQYKDHS